MHRIDTEGSKNGKFYDGDPSGTDIDSATVLSADWLNAMQDEICSVITADGRKLRKEDSGQMIEIIRDYLNPVIKAVNLILTDLKYNEVAKLKEI